MIPCKSVRGSTSDPLRGSTSDPYNRKILEERFIEEEEESHVASPSAQVSSNAAATSFTFYNVKNCFSSGQQEAAFRPSPVCVPPEREPARPMSVPVTAPSVQEPSNHQQEPARASSSRANARPADVPPTSSLPQQAVSPPVPAGQRKPAPPRQRTSHCRRKRWWPWLSVCLAAPMTLRPERGNWPQHAACWQ